MNAIGHTAYHHVGHTAYHHVGDDAVDDSIMRLIRMAAVGIGAYHGYRRNDSVAWATGWGLLAGTAPVIVVAIALAQGFGKRKGK